MALTRIKSDQITDGSILGEDLNASVDLTDKTLTNFKSTGIDDNATALAVTINADGQVGIGTDTPEGSLHIKRQDTVSFTEKHTDFILENPGLGNARFFLKTSANNRNWEFFADDNDGAFGIYDGVAAARRFTIMPDGNIGIGISLPTARLNIVTDTTTDALRITQTGSGNALVVEDSANPDSTPFVIDSAGTVFSGANGFTSGFYTAESINVSTSNAVGGQFNARKAITGTQGAGINLLKSRGSIASQSVVLNGDTTGKIETYGYDGTNYIIASRIESQVDGDPGTNDMPGRLVFSTTADGASTPSERMRITNAGLIHIGGSAATSQRFVLGGAQTLGAYPQVFLNQQTLQSDATGISIYFDTYANTAAASFTLSELNHFRAVQGAFGVGSTVTNQRGFHANATLTGATNNYGFYSNIASGTGRWNFFAGGSAPNFMAGPLYVGFNYYSNVGIGLGYNSGTTAGTGIYIDTSVAATTTSSYNGVSLYLGTQAGAFTLTTLNHYVASQAPFGAGSTVTNQAGFVSSGALTGATNNYGFFSNIPTGTGRWNFYAAGTAANYFAGSVTVAATTQTALSVTGGVNIGTSTATTSLRVYSASNWNFSNADFIRNTANTNNPRFIAMPLDGDDLGSTTIGAYNAIWGAYDSAPTTGSTSAALNGAMVYGAYAGHRWVTNGTERMRIDNVGRIGIGTTPASTHRIVIGGAQTLGASPIYLLNQQTIQSDATGNPAYFYSYLNSQAGSYTISGAYHFRADAAALGAGSALTSQYGFFAGGGLTGATNNFGVRSEIASGAGRWNFYAGGSADNYFAGNVGIGTTAVLTTAFGSTGQPLRIATLGAGPIVYGTYSDNAFGSRIDLVKSRGSAVNSQTIIQNNDVLGEVYGVGSDGTNAIPATRIAFEVDGAPGTNDMPGRIAFATAADGASAPTERMRIDNQGRVGIGGVPYAGATFLAIKNMTGDGGTGAWGITSNGAIQSSVTAQANYFLSSLSTAATAFTLSSAYHYRTYQGTIGAGSTVTNQYGFFADNTLAGATNDYGFYGEIAAGTGRYNFYAGGTADNFFAGRVGIGALPASGGGTFTVGGTSNYGAYSEGIIYSGVFGNGVSSRADSFISYPSVNNTTGTTPLLTHFFANQNTFSTAVTTQAGFYAESGMTGATNNYGFHSNIASGTGRWNFYAAGTAANYFAGNVGIGIAPIAKLDVGPVDSADEGAEIRLRGSANGTKDYIIDVYQSALRFSNSDKGSGTITERMRIDNQGNVIYTPTTTVPSLAVNGTMVFNLTSNTNLRVSVRGTDGITRTANITLA